VVGTLTSAAHGHTVGRPVALGYVACRPGATAESLLEARYQVDIAGARVAAMPALRAWHDPHGTRLRA
jgi:4-methylaminobutanoate oxidase (formaldehyde-forming)